MLLSSRKALLLNALILLLIIVLIRLVLHSPDAVRQEEKTQSDSLQESFMATVKEASAAIVYLYEMQKCVAEVAPVVESEKEPLTINRTTDRLPSDEGMW